MEQLEVFFSLRFLELYEGHGQIDCSDERRFERVTSIPAAVYLQ